MGEHLSKLSTQEALAIAQTMPLFEQTYGLPRHLVTLSSESSIISPIKPSLFIDGGFYATPDIFIDDQTINHEWLQLNHSLDHILSPFTKTNALSHDIEGHAENVFLSGMKLKHSLDQKFGINMKIVLPLSIQILPLATYQKSFLVNNLKFQFNIWEPAQENQLRLKYKRDKGEIVTSTDMSLTLLTKKNCFSHNIDVNLRTQQFTHEGL